MPRYEYRCRTCDARFEQRRTHAEADAPAECPEGHVASTRLLSVFAAVGASDGGGGEAPPAGPCGSACACM